MNPSDRQQVLSVADQSEILELWYIHTIRNITTYVFTTYIVLLGRQWVMELVA